MGRLVARDAARLRPYGRFLLTISERILADQAVPLDRTTTLPFIYGALAAATGSRACQ